jgi:hypothetical protein
MDRSTLHLKPEAHRLMRQSRLWTCLSERLAEHTDTTAESGRIRDKDSDPDRDLILSLRLARNLALYQGIIRLYGSQRVP